MNRKFTVTIEDCGDGNTTTAITGQGFNPFELIGHLEQIKATLLEKAEENSKRHELTLNDLLDKLGKKTPGGFNIEDLLGGIPGIKKSKDESN